MVIRFCGYMVIQLYAGLSLVRFLAEPTGLSPHNFTEPDGKTASPAQKNPMLSERLNRLCGEGGSKIVRKFARKHLGRRSAKKQCHRPIDGPMNEWIDQQTDRPTDGQTAQHSG